LRWIGRLAGAGTAEEEKAFGPITTLSGKQAQASRTRPVGGDVETGEAGIREHWGPEQPGGRGGALGCASGARSRDFTPKTSPTKTREWSSQPASTERSGKASRTANTSHAARLLGDQFLRPAVFMQSRAWPTIAIFSKSLSEILIESNRFASWIRRAGGRSLGSISKITSDNICYVHDRAIIVVIPNIPASSVTGTKGFRRFLSADPTWGDG
jgi:hypothetical protein